MKAKAELNDQNLNAERNQCEITGKICYSRRTAGEIINSLKKHRKSDHLGRNKKMPKRSYVCRDCGSYHLTHEPFMKTKESRAKFRYEMDA